MNFSIEYWKEKANKCQTALLNDLIPLLEIESVRDDTKATPDTPLGPGPAQALQYMLDLAKRDGFECENVDNYAGVIRYGKGEKILGILAHLDVVPATGEWTTPAFQPTIRNGHLYARGATDDKGPAMAAYYALKLFKETGIEPNMQIHLILGTDEESSWECMEHYFKKMPLPTIAFSPDADFPIINGEKGIVNYPLHFDCTNLDTPLQLHGFEAGIRSNIVPEVATATFKGDNLDEAAAAWLIYVAHHPEIKGDMDAIDDCLALRCFGKSAHAMEPECGHNAATYLADFLSSISFRQADHFFHFIRDFLHKEFDGTKLGIASHDDIMGDVTVNPGLLSIKDGKGKIVLNIRFPRTTTEEAIRQRLKEVAAENHFILGDPIMPQGAHYVPPEDPLVETLLAIYREHTGKPAQERSIGGGTYASLIPKGVAYGMTMPESDVVIHQPDESLILEDLEIGTAIYADAIYRLISQAELF